MSAVSLARAILLVLSPLCLTSLACAEDSQIGRRPIEVPFGPEQDSPDDVADNDDYRIILTAGKQARDEPLRPEVKTVGDGTSSRRARRTASDDLGLHRLPWQNQHLVEEVVDNVSIFRRLPSFRCEVDPRVHDYFVHNPDVAVSMWRAMGISQLQLSKTGEWSYRMDTNDGTSGSINVLYRSRESCLILCNGTFKSPYLASPIAARAVMHLRTRFTTDQSGRTFAIHQADMFVSFPSQGVETVAKLISPVSNVIIDRNFQEISLFLHVMWLAMGRQPGWVEQIAEGMDGVREEQLKELVKLTAKVYVDSQAAHRRRTGQDVTLEAIRPPTQTDKTRPVSTSR